MSEIPHIPRNIVVRSFLAELFDYAGLFPPAALSMRQALVEYGGYRAGPDAWMLGPFVCRISALEELEALHEWSASTQPLRLSLIASRESSCPTFLDHWKSDVELLRSFIDRRGEQISLESIEVALPAEATDTRESARTVLASMLENLTLLPKTPGTVFLEVTRDEHFESRLMAMNHAIASRGASSPLLGLKLRCGGMEESDFPTSEEIAAFIMGVIDSGNRFKATAGLHHPVRKWNADQGLTMHGFLNVFFGAAFYAFGRVSSEQLIEILEEEDPSAFSFEEAGIRWRDIHSDGTNLDHLRCSVATSIGSCSFDEPREDLSELGWLRPQRAGT